MKGIKINSISIVGEDGSAIKAYRDNMGEPYRAGISLWIYQDGMDMGPGLFIEDTTLDDLIAGLQTLRKAK